MKTYLSTLIVTLAASLALPALVAAQTQTDCAQAAPPLEAYLSARHRAATRAEVEQLSGDCALGALDELATGRYRLIVRLRAARLLGEWPTDDARATLEALQDPDLGSHA